MGLALNKKLEVDLNGFKLKNPILCASGTFGYCDEFENFVDIEQIGAIVTKAITLHPRSGNNWQRVFEVEAGMINSVGLENIGISAFIENKLPLLKLKNVSFIVNVAGATQEEYIETAKICQDNDIQAIELNISCPNVKHGCLEFGTDEKSLETLVKAVRDVYKNYLIVKLTPNVTHVEKIAIAAQNAGANALSAINTVKALGKKMFFDKKQHKFVVTQQIQGGLSGKAIKPIALGIVNRISKIVDIPIIGIGGIHTLQDVFEFISVGADAVQVGTANFTHPNVSQNLIEELTVFLEENEIKDFNELKAMLRKDN